MSVPLISGVVLTKTVPIYPRSTRSSISERSSPPIQVCAYKMMEFGVMLCTAVILRLMPWSRVLFVCGPNSLDVRAAEIGRVFPSC
ncbi:unnamed protein product [Cylicocyclus nassatus]|uniref:Uncharacterized protein n=1 Tax=Cylicocyclus nassatus TaxID=53992 RepID=A0AA36M934_CYLNA|nr:unnamed protein product [Cylicocyclus nassatus]